MIEVEYYRRLAEEALDRRIATVAVPDPHCLGDHLTPAGLRRALAGRRFTATRRRGKLLLLDTDGPTVGIRFGMTGGLVVDDRLAVDRLLYGPERFGRQWVRLRLGFEDGGSLALHDPRRFGRVMVDPDEGALGPDALDVSVARLDGALAGRGPGGGPPIKARLLDQSRLAGVGNLLADEILWRASLSPWRPSGSLDRTELRRLHRTLGSTLRALTGRGGSHTGDLMAERRAGGHSPRDGSPLVRDTVGGRTTWWCPAHQR